MDAKELMTKQSQVRQAMGLDDRTTAFGAGAAGSVRGSNGPAGEAASESRLETAQTPEPEAEPLRDLRLQDAYIAQLARSLKPCKPASRSGSGIESCDRRQSQPRIFRMRPVGSITLWKKPGPDPVAGGSGQSQQVNADQHREASRIIRSRKETQVQELLLQQSGCQPIAAGQARIRNLEEMTQSPAYGCGSA